MVTKCSPLNVDTVEFRVLCDDVPHMPDADVATRHSSTGELTRLAQPNVSIEGKNGHNLSLYINKLKQTIKVSGSPFAFATGQNVFTPDDMQEACYVALCAMNDLGLRKSHQTKRWKMSDVYLLRSDIAANLLHSSLAEIESIFHWAGRAFTNTRRRAVSDYEDRGLVWRPNKGEEYEFRLYAKGPEMRAKRRNRTSPAMQPLIEEVENILRIELQLRGRALHQLDLRTADKWTKGKVSEAFSKYFKRLPLENGKGGPIPFSVLDSLPQHLRQTLAAYSSGINMAELFPSRRTLLAHRKALLEHGWDINQPYCPKDDPVQLKDALGSKKAIRKVPAWLREAGLYYEDF